MTAMPDRHNGESLGVSHHGFHVGYARGVRELEGCVDLGRAGGGLTAVSARHGYPGDRRRALVVPRPHRRIQQGIPAGLAGDGGLAAAVAAGFHRAGGKTALGKGGKGAVEVHGVIASSRSVHSKEDWLLHLVTGQSAPRWRMPLLFTRWYRAAGKNTALPCWHPVNT